MFVFFNDDLNCQEDIQSGWRQTMKEYETFVKW